MSFSYEKVQSKNIILAGFRDQVSPKILSSSICMYRDLGSFQTVCGVVCLSEQLFCVIKAIQTQMQGDSLTLKQGLEQNS